MSLMRPTLLSRAFHSRRKLRAKQHVPAAPLSELDVAAPLSEQLHEKASKGKNIRDQLSG
jgi:hypothetical protein